jgi:hypothetical protein
VFNVAIEGQQVISNLDLVARVGSFTAYVVTVPVNVQDGALNISFQSVVDNAKVSAIQVVTNSNQVSGNALLAGRMPKTPANRIMQRLIDRVTARQERDGNSSNAPFASNASEARNASDARSLTTAAALTKDYLETAEVTIGQQWKRVEFQRPFADPVVVAKALSYHEASPAVVRIRGVDATGFELRLQSWQDPDEGLQPETAGYLVLERGRYALTDGTMLEAGKVEVNRRYPNMSLPFTRAFRHTPVVMTAVSNAPDAAAVTGRPSRISKHGFRFYLQFQDSDGPEEETETISYVAWEPSSGTIDGFTFEVGRTLEVRRDQLHTIAFREAFADAPIVLADFQGTQGGDPLNLRWGSKDLGRVDVKIDEASTVEGAVFTSFDVVGYLFIR